MFQSSTDQTQWFHLYRVKKLFPIMFVLFSCGEGEVEGVTSQVLDLRLISTDPTLRGGSWWVKAESQGGKHVTRADLIKFLELQAKFQIAHATQRSIEEIEMVDSSHDELALAVALDPVFKSNLEAVMPTLFPRLARNLIKNLETHRAGIDIEELTDWPERGGDEVSERAPLASEA